MSEDKEKSPIAMSKEKAEVKAKKAREDIEKAEKVLVKSNGTPATTSVETADGSKITNVTNIKFEQSASDVGKLTLEIIIPSMMVACEAGFVIDDVQKTAMKKAIDGNPAVAEAMVEMMEEIGFIFLKKGKE